MSSLSDPLYLPSPAFTRTGLAVDMSVATPTVLPRPEEFPNLLPKPPQPHPTPLPKSGRSTGRLNTRRDLQREMDDLSDEENELEDIVSGHTVFHVMDIPH